MVTRGDLFPARFAIACYRAQTYPNRELIVVCDNPHNEVGPWIATLNDPSIRYVLTDKAVLGALRNLSVEKAEGTLLCQWDDDDLYHPNRLAYQQRALAKTGMEAHFLSQWTMWWPRRRLLALSPERLWEGSMLVYRDIIPKYPEIVRGEDTPVLLGLAERKRLAASKAPHLYCYIVHGGNSWNVAHFKALFGSAPGLVRPERYDDQLERLAKTFPVKPYLAGIQERNVYTMSG